MSFILNILITKVPTFYIKKTMYKSNIVNDIYITCKLREYEYYFVNATLLYPNGQSSTSFNHKPKVIILL